VRKFVVATHNAVESVALFRYQKVILKQCSLGNKLVQEPMTLLSRDDK
jgi:hypothetical protein